MMRRIFHLQPPSGRNTFALHRFSPYFEKPEEFGISITGPAKLYPFIFPVPESVLKDLVYKFSYEVEGRVEAPKEYAKPVIDAIDEWTSTYGARRPQLTFRLCEGGGEIVDTRVAMNDIRLDATESSVYSLLDGVTTERQILMNLQATNPGALGDLNRRGGLETLLAVWDELGLILRDGHHLLGLAVNHMDERVNSIETHDPIPAPLPYFEPADLVQVEALRL
jgi:hypothetical protein